MRSRGVLVAGVVLAGAVAASVGSWPGTAAQAATDVDQRCATSGTVAETGTAIVSHPVVGAIAGEALAVPLSVSAAAEAAIAPGGRATTVASATVDLAAQAHRVLVDQVHPAVAAAGYPQLVDTSWVVLTLERSTLWFPLPAGATGSAAVASSPSVGTSAAFDGGDLVVTLGTLAADTRLATSAPLTVTVGWTMDDGGAAAPRTLATLAPSLRFEAWVDVGVRFSGAPLVGGVHATWACQPDAPATVVAATDVVDDPPTGTAPVLPTPGAPPSFTAPTTAPPQTWPTKATPPSGCAVSGFDRYGGWSGLSLEATGAFRTAQVRGQWWLVDPLGHPFFSQGVNHVTYQGTPDRNGATPYHDAAVARYGSIQAWADAQVARFHDWGYNTAGGWSDREVQDRMPYVLLVNLTGQDFGTGVKQDLWDPGWASSVAAKADAVAAEVGDDPNLVGYWTDNELHWGPDWRPLHLFEEYLQRPASSAGKQHLVSWLQARYPTFAAFEADIATTATSWGDLAAPTSTTGWSATGGQATRNAWMGEVAERYFSVTVGSLRAADPVHLQFGPRMIAQVTGTPVLEAAGRWVDVASFNDYAIDPALLPGLATADPTYLPTDDALAAQAAVVRKPILISEWGFRAADSGLPNTWPPLFPTLQTQDQRAGASQQFVQRLLASPWVVGQHIFEHADEPSAGRFDGEDSNFGLVDNADDPYEPMVEVSRWVHDCAYARLVQQPSEPTSTTTTASAGVPVAPATPAAPVEASARYTG